MSWGNSRAQMMEQLGLEEGEARYYKDDDDTSIDPDIALSYIDEKLQSVLGHFQKDFEGGVSAENLGAKFGGYGSFLPTYQRSPTILSQQRTPQRSQNQGTPRSPNHMPSEGRPLLNSKPMSDPPSTQRSCTASSRGGQSLHNSRDPCGDDSARQDACFSGQVSNKLPVKHELSMSKSLVPTDQRKLKLRIRLGSDKTAEKSTALHTSLGLISPSSSMENSLTESGEMSGFQEISDDSPASILQTMTSFPVMGGQLLSPLHEKLLTLSRNENLHTEDEPLAVPMDANPQTVLSANSSTSRLEDGDVLIGKKTKSVGRNELIGKLNSGVRNDRVSSFQKKRGLERPDNRHCFSNDLNQSVVPDLVCDTHESVKGGRARETVRDLEKEVPMKKREINRLKNELFGSDLDKDESCESLSDQNSEKFEHQEVRSSSMEPQLKNASVNSKEHGRSAPSFRADSDISESEKDSSGAVSLRKKAAMKAATHKPDQPRMEKKSSAGKKKLPEPQPSLMPAADPEARVSAPLKSKKISKKDVCIARPFDSHVDAQGKLPGDKLKKSKLEVQSSFAKPSQVPSKKVDSHVASGTAMKDTLTMGGTQAVKELTSEVQPSVDPVVIAEDWVGCDKCQKWRLLPYGTKPEHLPERWHCSMLNWLSGMNRCDISEEETTNALHALYQMPLPENHNSLQNHAASTDLHGFGGNSHQNVGVNYMANGGKKKLKLRETPNTSSNNGPLLTSNLNMQQELGKSTSVKYVNQPVGESNVISKSNARIPLKSSHVLDKNLNKPKQCMANGDEKTKKKSKRESLQYNQRDLKNLKIDTDKALLATREVVTDNHERGNLKEVKSESTQILENKHRNRVQDSRIGGSIDVREPSVKKRKLSDRDYLMDSQSIGSHLGDTDANAFVREVSGENGIRKQKKSKVLQTEKKESSSSKGEDRLRTRGTRIVLPGTRDLCGEREPQTMKYRVKVQSRLTMEDIDSLKKDLGGEELSTAATSSSSKVSDSRKRRANHQVKGSPVESVSSSPMRMIIPTKASPARMESSGKDDTKLGEYLDRDGDFKRGRSMILIKGNRSGVPYENSVIDSRGTNAKEKQKSCVKPSSDLGNRIADVLEERSPLTVGNGKIRVSKKPVSMLTEHKSSKESPLQFKKKDHQNAGFNTQRVEDDISGQLVNQEVSNSKKCQYEEAKIGHNFLDSSTKSFKANQNVSKKDPTQYNGNRREKHDDIGSNTKLNCASDMEGKNLPEQKPINGGSTVTESRSQIGTHAENKQGTLGKLASCSQKGSLQAANTSLSASVSKDPGIAGSMGNLEPDLSKRETASQTASIVLREAEGRRDYADRLKSSGFHAEYNQAYFQAALMFLQGASLLENSRGESSKSGEMNQVQIYSNTAKLCETCAYEYAKCDEFATAALAYKCMEVACMRVIYCKNMSSGRVWHDLQASLNIPPQGESPSSSASDVDNTNNQPMAEKTALSKCSGPHALNHIIAPRNRPNYVRLLDFTKDVNFAMEASRKAQDAFVAANAQADNKEAIMSVKRVIDFSFQDVEELIRLVRQAFEAISHNTFGGRG